MVPSKRETSETLFHERKTLLDHRALLGCDPVCADAKAVFL